ncbi:MAG: type II secretion system F family protein [Deltaproteobacteria bacterium]|nr:type II secretion system F family protein [Deltaproteobacteria bacterium]
MIYQLLALGIVGLLLALWWLRGHHNNRSVERVESLLAGEDMLLAQAELEREVDSRGGARIAYLQSSLGKAGGISSMERRKLVFWLSSMPILSLCFGAVCAGLAGGIIGAYIGVMLSLFYYRHRVRDFTRELCYRLPMVLESFILLVESGLEILPALERLVSLDSNSRGRNPVIKILNLVYQLTSHGLPFNQASKLVANACNQKVLRHVLLHLDISGSEGGEIIKSLQSLSDYAHAEWKQSVSVRIKRLENKVVFPIFASVLGLLVLAAAGPFASIADFKGEMEKRRADVSSAKSLINVNRSLGGR